MKTQTIFSDPCMARTITSAICRRSEAKNRMGWARAMVQRMRFFGRSLRIS